MKHFKNTFFFSVLLLIFFIITQVNADEKKFARSYTSYTLPSKALEFEFWQTGRFDKVEGFYYRWQPRFEIEYGVTDRLTASVYFNFNEIKSSGNTIPSKPLSLSTTSFEFRYRLSNPNEYLLDPALYFEFGYGGDKIFYEPKILLSKRFEKFTSVVNLVSEIERAPASDKTESKFEISAGIAYDLTTNISLGMEFRNHRNYSNIYEKELNQASFLGPTISLHTERLYVVVNILGQITGGPTTTNNLDLIGHEKYELRMILGIGI